tara:strand:+ start:946 stop:1287 length:342 start_codon:yes stop_codon:yes gene_type:complete
MEGSEGEDEPSKGPMYGLFWFLCFLFPPLLVLALPFWLVSMFKDSGPSPEPQTLPLDIPPPVKGPAPRPQPEYDVFPTKSDYDGPETLWWDVDDVPVGREHNRPEDKWWELSE